MYQYQCIPQWNKNVTPTKYWLDILEGDKWNMLSDMFSLNIDLAHMAINNISSSYVSLKIAVANMLYTL